MSIANVRSGFSSMPFALFGDLGDFAVSFASLSFELSLPELLQQALEPYLQSVAEHKVCTNHLFLLFS